MPFGPHAGQAESFARTDLIAAGLEVAVVAAALWWARRASRPLAPARTPRRRVPARATAAVVAASSIAALTGAAGHAHPGVGHEGPSAVAHYADGHSR